MQYNEDAAKVSTCDHAGEETESYEKRLTHSSTNRFGGNVRKKAG